MNIFTIEYIHDLLEQNCREKRQAYKQAEMQYQHFQELQGLYSEKDEEDAFAKAVEGYEAAAAALEDFESGGVYIEKVECRAEHASAPKRVRPKRI